MPNTIAFSAVTANGPVRLEGGPVDLSGTVNLADYHEVIFSEEKIKIRYGNGYEHYTPFDGITAEAGAGLGPGPRTFRWVGRTKIAE